MLSVSILIATLVGIAQAQTPEGFIPQVNTQLGVFFNSTPVRTPGQQLTKAGTASQPQLAASRDIVNSDDTYVFVMLDLDVPPAEGTTERRVLLHAMNTGFKATQQQIGGSATLLASTDRGPAPYLPPGPPATDTMAHRYVQLLFQQPESLQVQATDFQDTQARFNFDIESFASQNGLGEPLAGNFFTVDGRTGGASPSASASASASGGASGTGGGIAENTLLPPPFEGGAQKFDLQWSVFGLLGGAALAMI